MIPTLKRPNVALFILLLAPFIRPVGVDAFPLLGKVLTLWKLLALLYLAIALIPKLASPVPQKKSLALLGLGLFWCIYLFGCLRVGRDVVSVLTAGMASILLFLLVEYETRNENGWILLKAVSVLSAFCILAHILSVVLVQTGIVWLGYVGESPVYLFGMDNYSAFFIYPMLTLMLYGNCLLYGKLRIWDWLLAFAAVGVYLFTKSLTAAGAGIVILALLLFKEYWGKLPAVRGARWIIAVMILLLVLICGFQAQNLLAFLLDKTSKGVTLNSRTYIWECALNLISQKPFFGHGTFTDEQLFKELVLYGISHAHNLLLELLVRTGIVGTAGYLLFLLGFSPFGVRRAVPKAHGILLVGLLGQLMLSFMDFYPTILIFYIFLAFLYFSHRFSEEDRWKLHADKEIIQ